MLFLHRTREILLHTGLWACFIGYELVIVMGIGNRAPVSAYILFYALNIALFYFHAHRAMPYATSGRYKFISFALVTAAELAVYGLFSTGLDIIETSVRQGHFKIDVIPSDYYRSLWRGVYFLLLSTGYSLGLRSIRNAKKATKLLQEKLDGERREARLENEHLRAQINPHLLYNTLDFVHSTVEDFSSEAAEVIMLLSDSMRYAVRPADKDGLIGLDREVEQIDRLVLLHQLRLDNQLRICRDIHPACMEQRLRIPPLLFLTFIENMFKHGNLLDAQAIIRMHLDHDHLLFYTSNLVANRRNNTNSGIGVQNARARLEKYYPGNYILESSCIGANFIVDLRVKL
jgi:two-component system LytT family sensor kinase